MPARIFAAIVIGSAETEMRIYEFTSKKTMRQIDLISKHIPLGVDAYSEGHLDPEKVEDLCDVLKEYRTIMMSYGCSDYDICATSALREIRSSLLMQDYIEKQTGLKIRVISNSEQRFLDYKSIASESTFFEKIIQSGTAIVDIDGSSIQISVFDNDKLVTTQNIRMGKISSREKYYPAAKNNRHYESLLVELLEHELTGFSKLYQRDRQILNLIVVDQDLQELIQRQIERSPLAKAGRSAEEDAAEVFHVTADQFKETYDKIMPLNPDDISRQYEIAPETALMIPQSMIFCRVLLERIGAQTLWLMDASICDGLCYDYGIANKLIKSSHNFDDDIIAASRNIAKRYKSNQPHIRFMEDMCLTIFDRMKKIHGMKKRERLLLQIAAILHNCGKYISLINVSDCAYNIIMATEIIGLTTDERRIIAYVVKFNNEPFQYYREISSDDPISEEEYLLIAKLTSIMRVANALDRGHKQKCKDANVTLKDKKLIITVTTSEDLSLEKITLKERAAFFDEVFNVQPVIHQKKKM